MSPLIEFERVSLARGRRLALDSVTFSIAPGEHVAILGPNGSGKSSLIKAITRECYPLQGSRVRVFGQDTWDIFELRTYLGIVSNDLEQDLHRDFSALEIVLSGFFSSVGIWPHQQVTPAMRDKASQALDLLEIAHLAGRSANELSSGEARRVVIARALVHDPKALVLDEPANSLDLRAAAGLRSILSKIARAGTSMIVVTHHLADILPEVGRVICLKDGRVVRDAPKKRVLTAAWLSELFGAPVEVVRRDGWYHAW